MNPSFDPNILEIEGSAATLLGASCLDCDATMFPARPHCACCGGQTRGCRLPPTGVVRTYCRLAMPLPGVPPPVTIVRVQLAPDLIVQGVMAGAVDIGDRVAVVPTRITAGQDDYSGFGFARSDHE